MGLKLFVRLMLLVLVLAMAGPFFLKGPDGQPMLTVSDVKRTAANTGNSLKAQWRRMKGDVGRAAGNENAGKVKMFRWQDSAGQWHFSNEAPQGVAAEELYVDPDASRMDPIPVTRRSSRSESAAPAAPSGFVSPLRAKEVLDETAGVRDDLDARNEQMKRRLDEIH